MEYKIENKKQIIVTKPLQLDCGQTIKNFPVAYETYGELNEKKNNAILIFHALTGDQFVADKNPITNKRITVKVYWRNTVNNKIINPLKGVVPVGDLEHDDEDGEDEYYILFD